GKDNGVLLLIFTKDRQLRIEVGYGLEATLTDAASKLIIENDIVPELRQGDYYHAIQNGITSIIRITEPAYTGRGSPTTSFSDMLSNALAFPFRWIRSTYFPTWDSHDLKILCIWGLIVIVCVLAMVFGKRGKGGTSRRSSRRSWNSRRTSSSRSSRSRSSRRSSSSFSGGRGGRSGGGGASGSW
ncbi:hypothetical protein GF348_03695, partial [candidate division KSB3 bacterium]|nr:hypothetical protein [candidate division KSB3 bacterium]